MVVTCERCHTRFRVDESLIPPEGRRVRCSKCKHIFFAYPPAKEPLEEEAPEIPQAEGADEEVMEPTVKIDLQEQEEEEEYIEEALAEEAEDIPPPPPRERPRSRPILLGALMVLLVVLAGLVLKQYGVISWPWVRQESPRASMVIDRTTLSGKWDQNAFVPRIFVINGYVKNRSQRPTAFVKVKGILMGKNGKPLKETWAFCGNPITDTDVRTKRPDDLKKAMMNRDGLRGMNKRIAPGASIPFTLIFFDVPHGVESFGAEVIEASFP
jgi:predicted Zn finger-like uncharacterized protein